MGTPRHIFFGLATASVGVLMVLSTPTNAADFIGWYTLMLTGVVAVMWGLYGLMRNGDV
jgi:hypothetical protein